MYKLYNYIKVYILDKLSAIYVVVDIAGVYIYNELV